MVEIKVGQKWKSTDWWTLVASEKTVEITAVEGEMVYYSPGMFSVVSGHDDAGLDTWEERWELVEDVVENKFKVGQVWYNPRTEANNLIVDVDVDDSGTIYYEMQPLGSRSRISSFRDASQTSDWELVEQEEKPKFKVQDKVRTINSSDYWDAGEEGEVLGFDGYFGVRVRFPGQDKWWWVSAHNLELIEKEDSFDPVERPAHYNQGKYEVIDVIEDWGLDKNYFLGNVIKYVARSAHKGNEAEDLKKARFYLDRYIGTLES